MESETEPGAGDSQTSEQVRCLACGCVYSKPVNGALRTNPDCPKCGYVGWLATAIPFGPAPAGR